MALFLAEHKAKPCISQNVTARTMQGSLCFDTYVVPVYFR